MLIKQPVELDETTLKEIAKATGGKYFNAKDTKTLESIYGEIDQLEKTKVGRPALHGVSRTVSVVHASRTGPGSLPGCAFEYAISILAVTVL